MHTFPDPADLPDNRWHGVPIDDDVVLSHGQTLLRPDGIHHRQRYHGDNDDDENESSTKSMTAQWIVMMVLAALLVHVVRKLVKRRRKQALYTALPTQEVSSLVV